MNVLKLGKYWIKLSDKNYQEIEIVNISAEYNQEKDAYDVLYQDKDGDFFSYDDIWVKNTDGELAKPMLLDYLTAIKRNVYAMVDGRVTQILSQDVKLWKDDDKISRIKQYTTKDGIVLNIGDDEVYLNEKVCKEMQTITFTDIDGNKTIKKGVLTSLQLTTEQAKLAITLDDTIKQLKGLGVNIIYNEENGAIELFNTTDVNMDWSWEYSTEEGDKFKDITQCGYCLESKLSYYNNEDLFKITRK